MSEVALRTLRGRNPLGFFAALGALDVVTRARPEASPALRWTADVDPYAIISGVRDMAELVNLAHRDVERWKQSPVLIGPPDETGKPLPVDDLKVGMGALTDWFKYLSRLNEPADTRLLCALVAEGAAAKGKPESKPTQLHFTAGQQKFLDMARTLRDGLVHAHFVEALDGPWRYDSELPVFGWDAKGERIYALSAHSPSSVKKTGVPGADWLALLGLRFFPVSAVPVEEDRRWTLVTTGCRGTWKSETFTWPLWNCAIGADVVASLVAHAGLEVMSRAERQSLGVHELFIAPIRRSEQGGYGSFGAPNSV